MLAGRSDNPLVVFCDRIDPGVLRRIKDYCGRWMVCGLAHHGHGGLLALLGNTPQGAEDEVVV